MSLNTEVDYNNVVIKGTVELGVKGERGLQGFKGDQGIQGPPVPLAHELGDDPDLAVSQKLLTNSIADMEQSNEAAVMEATNQAGLAEAARDAAFVNADVYPDVAAGLAAVVDGEQFQVLSDEGLEYRRYRKDSATVATEVGEGFPTPKQVEGAVAVAQSAAYRAETARDAAFVNADVYHDVATGRAAVANGEQFQVVEGDEIVRYRRDSSTTQTEVARYPSAKKVRKISFNGYFSDLPLTNHFLSASGIAFASEAWRLTGFLPIVPNTSYTVNAEASGTAYHVWYDADKNFISSFRSDSGGLTLEIFTSPADAAFVRISTRDRSADQTYIYATNGQYDADKLNAILSKHASGIPATGVSYRADSVGAALDAILSSQEAIISGQRGIYNILDQQSDPTSPWFVNSWEFTKGTMSVDAGAPHDVVSHDSARSITLPAGEAANFAVDAPIVVEDGAAGRYDSYLVVDVSGDTLTLSGDLFGDPVRCSGMHEGNLGQHLSRMGYRGLAEHIIRGVEKYAYKKPENLLFAYHPPVCTQGSESGSVYDYAGTTKMFDVTRLPGTLSGGTVTRDGVTIIPNAATDNADRGISQNVDSLYLSRAYTVQQVDAGTGIEFSVPVDQAEGFAEVVFSVANNALNDLTKPATGRGRLEVLGDGSEVLFDATYLPGTSHHFEYIDFAGYGSLTIRISCLDDAVTLLRLGGVYAYRKSPKTPMDNLISDGDVVAFLGDSWTQFPIAGAGETRPLRPDGSTGDGMQFLSEHMRQYLADRGVNITTLNMGRGGMTSAWGRYWVNEIITLTPKPTHCVVLFGINDNNSTDEYAADADSLYDFNPDNMWSHQVHSAGGVFGSTTPDIWFANIQAICERLINAGIKPIVMMPAHTASVGQAQALQQQQLNRIAAGFSDVNAPRE